MARPARLATVAALLFVNTGCFELAERIVLDADESGEYELRLSIDMGPALDMMTDSPEARSNALAEMTSEDGKMPAIEAPDPMPAGVTWLGGGTDLEGDSVKMHVHVAFDRLEALNAPLFPDAEMGTLRIPVSRKGKKVSLSGPLYGQLTQLADEDTLQMMRVLGGDARFLFEISAPNHKFKGDNATRSDGVSRTWEYGIEEMMAVPELEVTLK